MKQPKRDPTMSAKPGNSLPKEATLQGGRYVIESTLGQGGFGITYRAIDTRLGRTVAIKELYPGGSERTGSTITLPEGYTRERWSKAVADFSREARTLSSLDHPGIVTVHDHFEENNTAYMVMHYIHGVNLLQRMKQEGGRLSEDEVLRYMSEVGDALSVLHNSKLLHRDIKPSNIMLNRQGHTVLIDFGAARAFLPDKTATYSVVLTQGFAPPEQVVGRGRLGPTADIYALAATCHYLLTGDLPTFGDDGKLDNDNISPGLCGALGHGLEFNPAERPKDVSSFIGELQGRIAPRTLTPTTKPATQAVQLPSAPGPKREEYETEVPDLPPPMPYRSGVSASNVSASNVSAIARAGQEKGERRASGRPRLHSAPNIANARPGTISAPAPKPPYTSIRDKERKPGASWLVMGSTIAVLLLLGGVSIVLGGRSSGSGGGTFITSAARQATSTTLASAAGLSTQQAITRAADATHTSEAQAQAQATAQTLAQNSVTQATTQSQSTAQALVLRTAQVQTTAQSVGTSTAEVLAQQQATVQALAQVYAQQTASAETQAQATQTAQAAVQAQIAQATAQALQSARQTAVQATVQVQAAAQAQESQTALALEAARHANAQSTANAQATVQASAQAQGQQATATSQAQARATTRAAQAQATAQAVVRTTATAAAFANAQTPPTLLRTLTDPGSNVWTVVFSPDGQTLAELAEPKAGLKTNVVRLWRVADGTLLRTLTYAMYASAIALSPDGQILAATQGGHVDLWRVSDGTLLRTLVESGSVFYGGVGADVAFSPDGQTLASTMGEVNVHLFRVSDGKEEYILPGGQSQSFAAAVAFSSDSQILASASGDAVRLWRVSDGSLLRTLTGSAFPIAFSPDGQTLASGLLDNKIKLWRVSDGSVIRTLTRHTDLVLSVAFSPDGQTLASGSYDNTIKLWRVSDGSVIRTLSGHTQEVDSVAFSPDGQTLASGSYDSTIKLWRVH